MSDLGFVVPAKRGREGIMLDERFTPAAGQDIAATERLQRLLSEFAAIDTTAVINAVAIFLAIAQKPGLAQREYAEVAGISQGMASKTLQRLGGTLATKGKKLNYGLIDFVTADDGVSHRYHLTSKGRALYQRVIASEPQR